MHIRNWLALALMLGHAWALAQTPATPPSLSLDDARAQRARAKVLKAEAEQRFEADKAECQSKVIAVGCMSSAKERHLKSLHEADALERTGRQAEREARTREAEAKAAKREAEAADREAEERADVARYREQEAQRAAERERRQAEEAAKLESRRSKAAADRAEQQKRVEARRQEDAKRAQQAPENARKAEERRRQHAERVKRIDERARKYAETLKRREAEKPASQTAQPAAKSPR